ncbi:hypothetical protein BD779DRAFT_1623255 [Infundibulicybe gibba]|nr:hypothetical protein BD779DRAFT_1623255 [Infundibulicybe gibba]
MHFLRVLLLVGAAQASWFGSDTPPAYTSWSTAELSAWLQAHNIPVPSTPSTTQLQELVRENWSAASAWTYDQYASAQKSFSDIRDSSFDAWDESRLREFLLEQGVVAPSGPREQLLLLAKSKYRAYTDAASSFSSQASSASSSASSAVSNTVVQATATAQRAFNDNRDWVYSSWDDSQLRAYLEDKGVLKTQTQKSRDQLLAMMRETYAAVTNPVYDAWSTSYMKEWLVSHNIIRSDAQYKRDELRGKLASYYYDTSDYAWSTWDDSALRTWLIANNVIKPEAQIARPKLLKLIQDNYTQAPSTFWAAWSDSQLRAWLVDHGYIASDAQLKRDKMVKIADEKYSDASSKTAAYLTWPDARLRAFLREQGVPEDMVPGDRPGLLQETRIRYIQTRTRAEALFARVSAIVNGNVRSAEDAIGHLIDLLRGEGDRARDAGAKKYDQTYKEGERAYREGEKAFEEKKQKAYENVKEKGGKGTEL